MSTPDAIDDLFRDWLRTHATTPSGGELGEFVAGLPLADQRRAARLYARGFARGCEFCAGLERAQIADDLAMVETRMLGFAAFLRAIRAGYAPPPPESTS